MNDQGIIKVSMDILNLKAVKSYNPNDFTHINLSKKINIFFGQNGSGKSTISGYFYDPDDPQYSKCSFSTSKSYQYIVYNSRFVEDSFYNKSEQPGIFTLSKKNKETIEFIENKKKDNEILQKKIDQIDINIENNESKIKSIINNYEKNVWNKTKNIRDSCLKDLLKGHLTKKLLSSKLDDINEAREIELIELKTKYNNLLTFNDKSLNEITIPKPFKVNNSKIEILKTSLISSSNSYLSELINELNNSDWVQEGINYIKNKSCPFCQKNTIDDDFKNGIKQLFDNTYNKRLIEISEFLDEYERENKNYFLHLKNNLHSCEYIKSDHEIWHKIQECENKIQTNIKEIIRKKQKPSAIIELADLSDLFDELVKIIEKINFEIESINLRINDYRKSIEELKLTLWKQIKFQCIDVISNRDRQLSEIIFEKEKLEKQKEQLIEEQKKLILEISEKESEISNIDETINSINQTLTSLGIYQFKIAKHKEYENFFQLIRENGESEKVYHSLSEGEKTIITFLYFIELCLGVIPETNGKKQIKFIVIDDPISSLSLNYIYEISSLIRCRLIEKENDIKLVILTHNLFFLQEFLIYTKTKEREFKKDHSLNKIVKNQYSQIEELKRNEIKNDYQSLWMILKDARKAKINCIVVPNTMRNILEHYFSFQCTRDKLKEVLDELANGENISINRAFYRYINNGSHSNNIISAGVMDISIDKYFEMFEKIFYQMGDDSHYKTMMYEDS